MENVGLLRPQEVSVRICGHCQNEITGDGERFCGKRCRKRWHERQRKLNNKAEEIRNRLDPCHTPWKKLYITLDEAQKGADRAKESYLCPSCGYFHNKTRQEFKQR